jgi:predicted acetyltransferase
MTGLEVIPATLDQQPILGNLLELYAHDFSEFLPLDLGADGRFGYQPLLLYWSDPNRHPFLVKMDGTIAGLVLVKREAVWDMAEFFVVRRYRRRGLGMEIAHAIWRRFPGPWEIRVMASNPALHFWGRAIAAFTGEKPQSVSFEKGTNTWHVFSFESKAVK